MCADKFTIASDFCFSSLVINADEGQIEKDRVKKDDDAKRMVYEGIYINETINHLSAWFKKQKNDI